MLRTAQGTVQELGRDGVAEGEASIWGRDRGKK